MRDRLTGKTLASEIAEVERLINAEEDAGIAKDAEGIAKEEAKAVSESSPEKVTETTKQNDKAMNNWPVADKQKVAQQLVELAKTLLG